MKKNHNKKLLIIPIVLFVIIFGITKYINLKNNLIDEETKKQNELKELINIDTLPEEFIDNYFEDVKNINSVDKENILIVVSKEKIDNTYGATDIIEAPNNQYFLVYQSKEEKDNAREKLNSNKDIISIENNEYFYAEITENETSSYNTWAAEQLGYAKTINVINEIDKNEPDRIKDVVVAIIDTGLDIDVFNNQYQGKLLETYDVVYPSSEMVDSAGHGTHIAGTIAETTPSNVKIMSVKASDPDRNKSGDEAAFTLLDLINAINYVVYTEVADVINFSIGSYGLSDYASNAFYQTIESTKQQNIIFVAAAGNDNTDKLHYPSYYNNTISVIAVDNHFHKTEFSNYGQSLSFSAPGYKIKSINLNQSGITQSGTSMAAPHVASVVAILKSFNKDLNLDNTISLLKKHTIDIGDDGEDINYGYGVVSLKNATFCTNDIECDEYNVFSKNDIDGLSTIKIEPTSEFTPEYNYGNITNIMNAQINLYYTEEDYYTKTLGQLIDNIRIYNYDPYAYKKQDVTIKYKDMETTINIDNTKIKSGWNYQSEGNNLIKLTNFLYTPIYKDELYYLSDYPQTIYIPSEINGKKVNSLADGLFAEMISRQKTNLRRVIIPSGVKNIGKSVFAINYSNYLTASNLNENYELPYLEIVFPDTIENIDESAFKVTKKVSTTYNRENLIFYVQKDSVPYYYAITNDIEYQYIDSIDVVLNKEEYNSFEKVNKDDLSININYLGSLGLKTETINEFNIKYNNNLDSFRYGDTNFILEFDTSVGFHIEKEISIKVNKIIPEYEIPTNLNAIINQSLSEIELPSNFEWMEPTLIIDKLGDLTYKVKYIPEDTTNYEIVENIDVTINVTDGKEIFEPEITISDKIYDGTNKVDLNNINILNLNKDEYTIENTTLNDINVGETIANIKIKLSNEKFLKYKFSNQSQEQEFQVNIKIVPQEITKPTLTNKKYIYNGNEQTIELNNFDIDKMDISGNKMTNVGEQNVIISLKNLNYIWEDKTTEDITFKFKIEKADLNIKDESKDIEIPYDGKTHSIDIKLDYQENTIIKYMNESNEYILDEIPKYSEVGTYIVKYKLFIDNNYNEYYGQKELKIIPQEIIKPTLTNKKYIYNGNEQTIELNNFDTNKMNISGNKMTNAGEQDVIISLKNSNYIWEDKTTEDITFKFKIEKADLNIKDESKDIEIPYDGKPHSIDIKLDYQENTIIKYMNDSNEYILDEIPKYSEVGTYIVKYKLFINDNYNEYYGQKELKIINNTIINKTIDTEGFYDGKYYTLGINLNISDYDIKYSVNNYEYNLTKLPKFKDVGEYTINYKITAKGYNELIGSNKIRIYGIKSIDPSLIVKNNIFVSKDNNFKNIRNKIETYSKTISYNLYNNKGELLKNDFVKTGDYIKIVLNDSNKYEFGISVLGDINGDGSINSADLLKIRQHLLKTIQLNNTYYLAADINDDSTINSADLLKIRQHLLGINTIK